MVRRAKFLEDDVIEELYSDDKYLDNEEAVRLFLRDKQLEGVSNNTIDKYLMTFHVIRRDLNELNIDKTLVNLNERDIEDLIIYWKTKVAIPTINGRLRVVKPFFNVLFKRGFIEVNPTINIKQVKEREIIKDTLDDNEVKLIVDYLKSIKTFASYRNLSMFYLMLNTGIRLSECLNIKIDDLKENNSIVIRLTKNGKERYVYPSKECWSMLNKYLKIRGQLDIDTLFVNMENLPLKKRYIQHMLSRAAKHADVNKKVSPHMLRRTYAKNSILGGMDVFSLSRLMGHSTLEITKQYAQIWGSDLQKQSSKTKDISKLFK